MHGMYAAVQANDSCWAYPGGASDVTAWVENRSIQHLTDNMSCGCQLC
jgi:hypothetical protein